MTTACVLLLVSATLGQTSEVDHVATIATNLQYPARLAPATGGGVYVTDPPTNQVVQFDATGAFVSTVTVAGRPIGIATHSDGRIFLSRDDGAVGVYSSALVSAGTVNPSPLTMTAPNGLAFDSVALELYVVDAGANRVLVFRETAPPSWTLVRSWGMGGPGLGQYISPQAIAIDSALHHVIVTDADNFRVQVFDPNGTVLFKFGYRLLYSAFGEIAWFARSEGVAVDACSNIYISDALMGTVRVFSATGRELGTNHEPLVNFGAATGQVRVPCDVMINSAGRLFVADTNNSAVEVFSLLCTTGSSVATTSVDAPGSGGEGPGTEADDRGARMSKNRPHPVFPDNPAEIVTAMRAGDYRKSLDFNHDRSLNIKDLQIAVANFGAGTVNDFLDDDRVVAEHPGVNAPHILDIANRCGRCHGLDGAPGGMLTSAGQENLCQSCHSAGKIAGSAWIGPGTDENSHPWGVAAEDLDPQSDLALHLDNGNVRCATCHDPHQSTESGLCAGGICQGGPFHNSVCQTNAQCAPLVNYMRRELYRAGGDHLLAQTSPNPPAMKRLTAMDPTLCGECHTDIVEQWSIAGHADTQADPFIHYDWSLSNRSACRQCHSGFGYIDFSNGVAAASQRGDLRVVDCLVCHNTHGGSQDESMLRIYDEVTLPSGQIITDAGPGATCVSCHNGRRQPPIPNPPGVTTIHYLSGGVMLEGVNGVTSFDGTAYELSNSNHTTNAGIGCTTCHMAMGPSSGPEVGKVGGHTFRLKDHATGFENVANTCASAACHPGATAINITANGNYDGDLLTEGIQDETRGLLDLLELALNAAGAFRLLDPITGAGVNPYWATKICAGGSRNGLVCTGTAPFDCPGGGTCNNSVSASELATVEDAIWNWEYVDNSGDLGVKNTGYAIGLLQIAYKGITNNPVANAAYRYSPAP
ncbi:MAG: NHL repeat-containing protein [Planctomycetota bacterium]